MRSDLPKFAGKSYRDGTPDEYKAVGQGMLVTFGKYSVNEADKTITTDIEGSSFPNLAGSRSEWSCRSRRTSFTNAIHPGPGETRSS